MGQAGPPHKKQLQNGERDFERMLTVWTQNMNIFIISDILYRNFVTHLFEILLFFSKNWWFC